MKLWNEFNSFFDQFIKKDGVVESFMYHWGTLLVIVFGVVVFFKLASMILSAPFYFALASGTAIFAYFTHKADVRINGNDSGE